MDTLSESEWQFSQGKRDCKNGLDQLSNDPDYILGYGEQYALEQGQAWQIDQMMERAREH